MLALPTGEVVSSKLAVLDAGVLLGDTPFPGFPVPVDATGRAVVVGCEWEWPEIEPTGAA